MHPKIILFQSLVKRRLQELDNLCKYQHQEAEYEHEIILNYLEFSDETNNYTELLMLEIANEELAYKLSEIVEAKTKLLYELESVKEQLNNLV